MSTQAVDVGIALAVAFVVLSMIASAVVELVGMVLKKRSKDLEHVIQGMLSTGETPPVLDVYTTSIFQTLELASRRKRGPMSAQDRRRPAYVSARAFADAVVEKLMIIKSGAQEGATVWAQLPAGPLKERLLALTAETAGDLTRIKAGLESWFDDTMDRLEGAYRRWSRWILLAVGLAIAVALNVSALRIVDSVWNDGTLREAVVDAAAASVQQQDGDGDDAGGAEVPDFAAIEEAVDELDALDLPIGWGRGWADESGWWLTLLGLPITAVAVMFGAPFWLGVLTRLFGARALLGKPPKATEDPASATSATAIGGGSQVPASRSAGAGLTTEELLDLAIP